MRVKSLLLSVFCTAVMLVSANQTIAAGQPADVMTVEESQSAVIAVDKINLNQADPAVLVKLPGIGPVTAQRIAEYREVNGPFKAVDDLLNIKGIGVEKLEKIRSLVTLS